MPLISIQHEPLFRKRQIYCELRLVSKKNGYADLQTTNMNIITALLAVNSNKRSVVLCKTYITIFGTMYSCESARTIAYSNDLVYQRCMLGLIYEEVASRLSVDPSTVWHVVQRFEERCTVDSCYTHKGPPKTLTALDEFIILEAVTNRPAIYLCEIQRLVEQTTGTTISESAICRFLHKNNFLLKKLQRVARQRNEELRAQFSCDCSLYLPEMLVFIDETGSDRRQAMRKFGYSLVGVSLSTPVD